MRPLRFMAMILPLLSLGTSVPALSDGADDAAMRAATVDSKTIAADSTETGLIGGRSAAGVGPSAPVVADGTPVPDSKGWWW
jgi:hypothetical protein